MSAQAGPPLLRDPACTELRPRWSGDAVLDTALSRSTARQGATQLFGADRTTRAVVRGFASSLLGPEGQEAEREAALFATSLALAVDGPAGDERLVAEDLAEILDASTRWGVVPRREPIRDPQRQWLQALLEGASRHTRASLALQLLHDTTGKTDHVLRLLRGLTIDPAHIYPTDVATLDRLHLVADILSDHHRLRPAEVSSVLAPHAQRPRIRLGGGYEIRLLAAFTQAVTEGWHMNNCLPATFAKVTPHGHTLLTVHRARRPVATVQLDPVGEIRQMLGPANRYLDRREQLQIERLLIEAAVIDAVAPDRPRGPAELVAARIACRAAVLLAAELESEPDPYLSTGGEPGDALLEQLGHRATMLTDDEMRHLRAGTQRPLPNDAEKTAWEVIGAMLAVSHVRDGAVQCLDGSPGSRIAVTGYARRILAGTFALEEQPPDPALIWLADDPAVSAPIRQGLREVLRCWRAGPWPAA